MATVVESIVLENFQSLRDRVEIPLRPLTFLYGPNSAGKSAVHDALRLFDTLLRGTSGELDALVNRWEHQGPDGKPASPIRLELNLGWVSFLVPGLSDASIVLPRSLCDDRSSILFGRAGRLTLRVEFDWRIALDLPLSALSIDFEGRRALQWVQGTLKLAADSFGESLQEIASQYGVDTDDEHAFSCHCEVWQKPLRFTYANLDGEGFRDYEVLLTNVANHVLEKVQASVTLPQLVTADRGLIADSELVTTGYATGDLRSYVESNASHGTWMGGAHVGLPYGFVSGPQTAAEGVNRRAQEFVAGVALARLSQELIKRAEAFAANCDLKAIRAEVTHLNAVKGRIRKAASAVAAEGGSPSTSGHALTHMPEALNDFANRCLRTHLFIDQGYQLHFDICELLPAAGSSATKDGKSTWSETFATQGNIGDFRVCIAATVVCSLIDKASRRLTFEDVGTGISCVLPVVVALHSGYSFMQQPELHLHPALQSALGDICIETVNSGPAVHILETHSEYLLLRCLKRVRQTTHGRQPLESPLRLKPEQIVVLYFDPQSDGSTKVKRIRVTEEGDFMDRWPRGFFEERGKDLFDE